MLRLFRKKIKRDDLINGLCTTTQGFSGAAIFGETGSGKTSSVGEEILFNAFRQRLGLSSRARSPPNSAWSWRSPS